VTVPTYQSFLQMHNDVAMPLMKKTETLGQAFRTLTEANDRHMFLLGRASSEALYNAACCLSLSAGAQIELTTRRPSVFFDVSPGLPPATAFASAASLIDARLDLCLATLDTAIQAGYKDASNIQVDTDLRALRDLRPSALHHILTKASMVAQPDLTSRSCTPSNIIRLPSSILALPLMSTSSLLPQSQVVSRQCTPSTSRSCTPLAALRRPSCVASQPPMCTIFVQV